MHGEYTVKSFLVRCPRLGEPYDTSLCSTLQIDIPDGMTYAQAAEFASTLLMREFKRYMVHEILTGLGMEKPMP